jgi:hypothetical protein
MKKIALTLATAAGVLALSAGPASATTVSAASNAMAQAQSNSMAEMQQILQNQDQLSAGEKAAALEANATSMSMAQAAAKATKDATSGYAQYAQ